MRISFTVPAIPIAQPRQRHRVIGQYVQNYTPTRHPVNAFKASVRMAAKDAYSGPPLQGPIRLRVSFVFPRPKRMFWKRRPMPRDWHGIKPDSDNCIKSLKDSLKGLVWADDSQVCDERIFKFVAAGDEQPHVDVMVETLSHE